MRPITLNSKPHLGPQIVKNQSVTWKVKDVSELLAVKLSF